MAQDAPSGPGVQAGGGLIGDDQLRPLRHGGGNQRPSGHAAGELKGIHPLCLRPQAVPGQDGAALRPGPVIPPAPADLRADFHQGIQVGDPLGHQRDLPAPEGLHPPPGEGLAPIGDCPLQAGVVWEDAQDAVGQQALSGAAGAHHRRHLARTDGKSQIPDHRQAQPPGAPVILGKGDGEVLRL